MKHSKKYGITQCSSLRTCHRKKWSVVSGLVFDYDYNDHFDDPKEIIEYVVNSSVPIPTHYFVAMTSFENKSTSLTPEVTGLPIHHPSPTYRCGELPCAYQ